MQKIQAFRRWLLDVQQKSRAQPWTSVEVHPAHAQVKGGRAAGEPFSGGGLPAVPATVMSAAPDCRIAVTFRDPDGGGSQ
jgi:hypothetical protein